MAEVTGVVQAIDTMEVETRFGRKQIWKIMVNGKKYGTLWKEPAFQAGDTVRFNIKVNGKFENIEGQVITTAAGSTPEIPSITVPPQGSGSTSKSWKQQSFPIDPLSREMSIIYQSSLNRATEVVLGMYQNLPAAEKKATTIDDLWRKIDKLADYYADKASGISLAKEAIEEHKKVKEEFQKLVDGENLDTAPAEEDVPI